MPVPSGRGRAGIPDFIVCMHGCLVGIETKSPDPSRKPTAAQLREIDAINRSGGAAFIVRTIEQFDMRVTKLEDSYREYIACGTTLSTTF